LIVGITIEDLDIKDLQEKLKITDNNDVKMVFENLMKGSRNHMRSFYKQILEREVLIHLNTLQNLNLKKL